MYKKLILPLLLFNNVVIAAALNPDVTQENLNQTVCVPGWTKTIRPKVSYTNPIKEALIPKGANIDDYELDHEIPLALGGAPKDTGNLMLQPWEGKCGARVKDVDEARTHRKLCKGLLTLKEAQARFLPWICPK